MCLLESAANEKEADVGITESTGRPHLGQPEHLFLRPGCEAGFNCCSIVRPRRVIVRSGPVTEQAAERQRSQVSAQAGQMVADRIVEVERLDRSDRGVRLGDAVDWHNLIHGTILPQPPVSLSAYRGADVFGGVLPRT